MKAILLRISIGITIVLTALLVFSVIQLRDRHSGYEIDLNLKSSAMQIPEIGFARLSITPEGFDTWNDANGDARYNKKDGDSYNDLNNNGQFDAVWLAGFHQGRPANGVNDSLWARSMVISDGQHRIALCVIDMMGFGNDEVITVRKRLKDSLKIDYAIVASTHVHSSPDLMGMWGPSPLRSGVDAGYREFVISQIVRSVEEASAKARPARLKFAEDLTGAGSLAGDSRKPEVYDAGIRLMQVLDAETNATLGTLLNWGNHPETLWSGNLMLTSDFPHYYRKYVEEGIYRNDTLVKKGLGGVALFMNGAVGGLMTTRPPDTVSHPLTGEALTGATFEKADAQGMALALLSLEALDSEQATITEQAALNIRARTIAVKMDNHLFQLAGIIGIFKRGYVKWRHLRTEVAAWSLGPALFMHVPGELYPEILNGGVEAPEGGDFGIAPVETPSLRSKVKHSYSFFGGLSNDEIGYIIPKSQWDTKAPFTYGRESAPYGEVNSIGPETAPVIYKELSEVIGELGK